MVFGSKGVWACERIRTGVRHRCGIFRSSRAELEEREHSSYKTEETPLYSTTRSALSDPLGAGDASLYDTMIRREESAASSALGPLIMVWLGTWTYRQNRIHI
jgi:hypothetical protein